LQPPQKAVCPSSVRILRLPGVTRRPKVAALWRTGWPLLGFWRLLDAVPTPDLASLRALVERGDGSDRAFVDGTIRLAWARARGEAERASLLELHGAVQAAALAAHAALRAEISNGSLSRHALRRLFDDVPATRRDHFVEEVLGIAYPPLDEPEAVPELIAYTPSGYDEIVHALDSTELAPGERFLDIGSGLGKAVMLAALLAGASSVGVERDPALHERAEGAARLLGLREARFACVDAQEMAPSDADVVFMYLPFTGGTLSRVLQRLFEAGSGPLRARQRFLCAAVLEPGLYPALVPVGSPKLWLQVYAWR